MFVYQFNYCSCIYESSYATISTHRTAKGAYKAMRVFILDLYNEWLEMPTSYRKSCKFGLYEDWQIKRVDVLD
jgi:uncharacterized protein (DUF2461 family)